jgi:pyruvate,water dikinase
MGEVEQLDLANKLIMDIINITAKDLSRVGNKAANLARLMSSGFNVPDGFCLTTEAYRQALVPGHKDKELGDLLKNIDPGHAEKVRDIACAISVLFDKISFPDEIAGEIKNKYRSLFNDADLLAVRSSATAEDLPGLSFAGQYESYLNIKGADGLLTAIIKCWASLWSERAIIYREKNGIGHDNAAMAVIIQRMVPAEISGVAFTADPATGDNDVMQINAAGGLGEKLVSGKINPDQYTINKGSLKIERDLSGNQQLLPDYRIKELTGIALKIEKLFGCPQDIEWAFYKDKIYILQSRNITASKNGQPPFPVIWGNTATREILKNTPVYWSNWNTRENMPYPLKPLSWSFFNDFLVPAINQAIWGMDPGSPIYHYSHIIDLVNGRTYWNMNLLYGHPLFRRIMRPIMGRIDHEATVFFEKAYHNGDLQPAVLPINPWQKMTVAATALNCYLRFPWFMSLKQIYRQCDEYWVLADRYDATPLEGKSNLDLLEEARLFGFVTARYAFPLLFIAGKAIIAFDVIKRLTGEWPGFRYEDLMIGIKGNKATEAALELFKLSRMPETVSDIFRRSNVEDVEKIESNLKPTKDGIEYLKRVHGFLERYGHRGMKDLDMGYPSWGEDRSYVYQMIKNYLQFGPDDIDPVKQFELSVAKRQELIKTAKERLSKSPVDRIFPVRRWLFQKMADVIHDCLPLRENEKYYGIRCFPGSRRIVLEIGRRYCEKGLLDDRQDIFYLTVSEIKDIENGRFPDVENIKAFIKKRKDDWQSQVDSDPPFIIRSDGRQWRDTNKKAQEGNVLRGVGASSGRATGRARIIRDPSQAHLFKKGEILVAPYTEPGWAPLFLLAKALVMEVGGALCHGAIVAREYGIPAVVGVNAATKEIRDGDEITVDGNSGEVRIS